MGSLVLMAVKGLAISWMSKFATKAFIQWAILNVAEQYVKSTKTTADDVWLKKIKEVVEEA
jgi:hypothetical protein